MRRFFIFSFSMLIVSFIIEIPSTMIYKERGNNSSILGDQEIFDIAFSFISKKRISLRWDICLTSRCLFPTKIRGYITSMTGVSFLFASLFYLIDFCIPFNKFEVGILNNLLIGTSQLHTVSWNYVKVLKLWCEYKKIFPTLTFFFHLFKARRSLEASTKDWGLISLMQCTKMFDVCHCTMMEEV